MPSENVYVTSLDGAIFRNVPDIQPIRLVPGEQVWRLIRGNEGDVPRLRIVNEAALVMRWALDHGRNSGPPWELFQTGDDEWTFGDARPLRIEAVAHDPAQATLPKGTSYGRREQYPGDGMPAVIGSQAKPPWYVTVRFWWRGQGNAAAAWPALGFGSGSPKLSELGWMLDEARVPDVKSPDPGDKSWGKAKLDDATKGATKPAADLFDSLLSAIKVVAIVGGVYVGYRVIQDVRGK